MSRFAHFALIGLMAATLATTAAASQVSYIPAPKADSPARSIVQKKLIKLGKAQFQEAEDLANFKEMPCDDYHFDVELLLDSKSLYSLKIHDYKTCWGRSTQGAIYPLLYDMQTGLEYDINTLYHLRDKTGVIRELIRQLMAKSILRSEPNMSKQELVDVLDYLTNPEYRGNTTSFYPTLHGISFSGQGLGGDYADAVMTWAELRPHLDLAEAERLKWPHR